jgi:hypothetical protein
MERASLRERRHNPQSVREATQKIEEGTYVRPNLGEVAASQLLVARGLLPARLQARP